MICEVSETVTIHAASSQLFYYTDSSTTEIYPLSLHDALPICCRTEEPQDVIARPTRSALAPMRVGRWRRSRSGRSEEHTSELQSHVKLVCRLLLEKKNTKVASRT